MMKSPVAYILLTTLSFILSGCGFWEEDRFAVPEFEDRVGIDYKPAIKGVKKGALKELLQSASDLYRLRDKPPGSVAGIRARANGDVDTLIRVLKSEGYYKAAVSVKILEDESPLRVHLIVDKGPDFDLASYDIEFTDAPTPAEQIISTYNDVGLKQDKRARAEKIVAAEARILSFLERQGYPLAEIAGRKVFADFEEESITVRVQVTAGPYIEYGPAQISGLTSVKESHIRKYIDLDEGQPYDQRQVDAQRQDLLALGLFDTVIIPKPKPASGRTETPVEITLAEAKHRSVGGSVRYSTGQGPELRLFWVHRNFFGAGERLRVAVEGGLEDQRFDVTFRKPAFGKRDRDLNAAGFLLHTDNEAFEETGGGLSLGLEERLTDHLRVGGGTTVEISKIEDSAGKRNAQLLGLPLFAKYDSSNDLLDPTRGVRAGLFLTPYGGALGGKSTFFTVAEAKGSVYVPLDGKQKYVAAAHARLGSIIGESLIGIPASKRFYAGGGGSVRGYEFRLLGPLDDDNDPTGGRSVAELGAEMRIKITNTIGVVPFVEAGVVSENLFPASGEKIRYAAGLGGRYYSPIGPLRLDVGVPLNPRKVDDKFQLYISLGQAF